MEIFNKYWKLVTNKNHQVHEELRGVLMNIGTTVTDDTKAYLVEQVCTQPYPFCQILKLFPTSISDAVYSDCLHANVGKHQLNNLIANAHLSNRILPKFRDHLLMILKLEQWNNSDIYLSLLGRDNSDLLVEILKQEEEVLSPLNLDAPTNRLVFLNAVHKGQHFMLTKSVNPDAETCCILRPHLLLARLFYCFEHPDRTFDKFDDEVRHLFKQLNIEDLSPQLQVLYVEFKRIYHLICSVQDITCEDALVVSPLDFTTNFNCLDCLKGYCDFGKLDYKECKQMLKTNEEFNQKIRPENVASDEVSIFEQYYILKSCLEAIWVHSCNQTDTSEQIVERIFSQVGSLLHGIEDLQKFLNLIEVIFTMIFVRHDDEAVNESEVSDADDAYINNSYLFAIKSQKTGFVCNKMVLRKVLCTLNSSLIRRKTECEMPDVNPDFLNMFQRLRILIDDALWRLSILETKLSDSSNKRVMRSVDGIRIKLRPDETTTKSSSDDGDAQKNKSRRRVKRRPKSDEFNSSTDLELKRKSDSDPSQCPIAKMLMTPESLAAVCIYRDDLEAASQIIQTYSMESEDISRECNYSQAWLDTKIKLKDILQKGDNSESNIQQSNIVAIKQAASFGLEASKITHVIQLFAKNTRITLTESAQKVLSKHPTYKQFLGDRLQATIIFDLLLSLGNNYDMCLNIFNIYFKNYSPDKTSGGGIQIDSLPFNKRLLECVFLQRKVLNENVSAIQLLTESCYPLSKESLQKCLESERTYNAALEMARNDISSIEGMRKNLKILDNLRCEPNYFDRLINYLSNMSRLAQFGDGDLRDSVKDMMRLNAEMTIDDLIQSNMCLPTDLEAVVSNLNINMLHTLMKYIIRRPVMGPAKMIELNAEFEALDEITDILFGREPSTNMEAVIKFKVHKVAFEYVKKNEALLAYICQIHEENGVSSCAPFEVKFLQNYCTTKSVVNVKAIFDKSVSLAMINTDYVPFKFILRYLSLNSDYEVVLNAITTIPTVQYKHCEHQLNTIRDELLMRIVQKDAYNFQTFHRIKNINVKADFILMNVHKIESSSILIKSIKSVLLQSDIGDLSTEYKDKLFDLMQNMDIFTLVATKFPCRSGMDIMVLSKESPEKILEVLLDQCHYDICYKWITVQQRTEDDDDFIRESNRKNFHDIFRDNILAEAHLNLELLRVIEVLPVPAVMTYYKHLLNEIKNVQYLEYFVEFLIENCDDPKAYRLIHLSIKIFKILDMDEFELVYDLMGKPLMILEQMLMNSKFEILEKMLSEIKPMLQTVSTCVQCDEMSHIENDNLKYNRHSTPMLSQPYNSRHKMGVSCVDMILRSYADKSLEFFILDKNSSHESAVLSHTASLDSLCGHFVMPDVAPTKANWVRDGDATHCMCCKRASFTLLTRRHHCRRCGRVVCGSCSMHRSTILQMYDDIAVRFCNDCHQLSNMDDASDDKEVEVKNKTDDSNQKAASEEAAWMFSGNERHDRLLRDEFSYEYAPSVSLCLSILKFHTNNEKCVDFLLEKCRRFESLLRPLSLGITNPEVDYTLVTRILHCLSLAAKVRGGPPECDTFRDHAEIILSVVQSGCEHLLPKEDPTPRSMRKLKDALVAAEKFPLALELSHKCGVQTTSVMAAWGIACLKAGCFETAREKFQYCLQRFVTEDGYASVISSLKTELEFEDISQVDRDTRLLKNPPLLNEIINILEITSQSLQPNILSKAEAIKASNTSLMTKSNIKLSEPALSLMKKIEDAKKEAAILSTPSSPSTSSLSELIASRNRNKDQPNIHHNDRLPINLRFFEECLYYLITYGSHRDLICFLIKYKKVRMALNYSIHQSVDPDIFVSAIYLPYLRIGKSDEIITEMIKKDSNLKHWKKYLAQLCRFLEQKQYLNSLYQLQKQLNDPIRASMTCVKFYEMNAQTFRDLYKNRIHLISAQNHLQSELEKIQFDEMAHEQQPPAQSSDDDGFIMKMDSRALNTHINTILRQMEVTKFLSTCEQNNRETVTLLPNICEDFASTSKCAMTLFGSVLDKMKICVLVLICGVNVEEGFGLAYRIIQDFSLNSTKIYGITIKYLGSQNRDDDVEKLIDCVKANDCERSGELSKLSKRTVDTASTTENQSKSKLVQHLTDEKITAKINSHINANQLKSAYLLAVQNNRMQDLRRILRIAIVMQQVPVQRLCEKRLGIKREDSSPSSTSNS